jgi:hypothetical protein
VGATQTLLESLSSIIGNERSKELSTGDTVSNGNLDIERSHGGEGNNGRDGSKVFVTDIRVDYTLVGRLDSSALEVVD